jgi:hypothetical protein
VAVTSVTQGSGAPPPVITEQKNKQNEGEDGEISRGNSEKPEETMSTQGGCIDLTNDDNNGGNENGSDEEQEAQPASAKRQRTENVVVKRPKKVFVVIHDEEPSDSGSDEEGGERSSNLPDRVNTKIVSIHYNYADAVRAAEDNVFETFDLTVNSGDEAPLRDIDWRNEGWYRIEDMDADLNDDRVHIEKHTVS